MPCPSQGTTSRQSCGSRSTRSSGCGAARPVLLHAACYHRAAAPMHAACIICMLPPRCCPDACCVHHAAPALLHAAPRPGGCSSRGLRILPQTSQPLYMRLTFKLLTLHARHAQAKRYADAVRLLRAVRAPGPCSARAAPLGAPPRLWAQHRIAHRHRRPSLKPTLAVASLSGSSPTTLHSLSAGAGVAVRRAPARPHVQPPRTPPPSY